MKTDIQFGKSVIQLRIGEHCLYCGKWLFNMVIDTEPEKEIDLCFRCSKQKYQFQFRLGKKK